MPPFLWFGLPQPTFRCGLPGGLYGNSEPGRTRGLQAVTSHPEERMHPPTKPSLGRRKSPFFFKQKKLEYTGSDYRMLIVQLC